MWMRDWLPIADDEAPRFHIVPAGPVAMEHGNLLYTPKGVHGGGGGLAAPEKARGGGTGLRVGRP